jgi:hypothetical protein
VSGGVLTIGTNSADPRAMKAIKDCLRHAEECEALARTAVSEEQRQMIAKMASTWRMLAFQHQRHLLAQTKVDLIEAGLLRPEDS